MILGLYLSRLLEQDSMDDPSALANLLTAVLRNLPNCSKLSIADTSLPWGADKLASSVGVSLDRGFDPSSASYSFIRNAWLAILMAACDANDVRVASIAVNLGHLYHDLSMNPIEPQLLALQASDTASASLLSTRVKSLDLLLSTGSHRDAWRSALSSVISNFPKLESIPHRTR